VPNKPRRDRASRPAPVPGLRAQPQRYANLCTRAAALSHQVHDAGLRRAVLVQPPRRPARVDHSLVTGERRLAVVESVIRC
jgi:hypothetical protein